jgi:hypothetical protein
MEPAIESKKQDKDHTLVRPVAPEDIRRGTHVAVLYFVFEYIPFGCDEAWQDPRPRRVEVLPGPDAGTPLRVREVCLPYILVEHPDGKHRTLDVRRYRLGLLSERFAGKAFKRLAAGPKPNC